MATEKGLVDHLLLSTALDDAKIKLNEVKLVNTMTNELPQVFNTPDIDAIASMAASGQSGFICRCRFKDYF